MFNGTMIEELINSVCRAEEHARREQSIEGKLQGSSMGEVWQQPQYQELIEVA